MPSNIPLQQLIDLTRTLAEPQNQYVIIGEGNTSLRIDEQSFYVKASGRGMSMIDETGFVGVYFDPILKALSAGDTQALQAAVMDARVDMNNPLRPSIETIFHAFLLADFGVNCIAHTHPVSVNRILCSPRAEDFANHRLFPDEAVLCGPKSVFVPYVDPGLPLALTIRERTHAYREKFGEAPKVVLLANHGLIVLANTPTEALNITAMCAKAASIFLGAATLGGPVFMSEEDVQHIYNRTDEIYRRKQFVGDSST